MKHVIPAFLFLTLILSVNTVFTQKTAHPGIDLFLADKNAEALTSLNSAVKQKEFETNGEVWNFLGLANIKAIKYKEARKALEQAVKLTPDNSNYHSNLAYVYLLLRQNGKGKAEAKKSIELDPKNTSAYYMRGSASIWDSKFDDADQDAEEIMAIDPLYQQGYMLKSRVLLSKFAQRIARNSTVKDQISLLKEATEILKKGSEKCAATPFHKLVDQELESIEPFYVYFSKNATADTSLTSVPEPGVTSLKILSKPRPSYTDSARQGNVQGTITIAILFGARGKVENMLLIKRLGNGLDEEAMNAARKITFEPMKKDGKPVSVVKMVEYSFAIY